MLTECNWLVVNIKVERFRIWIPLPLFILSELIWQFVELMEFIGAFGFIKIREFNKALKAMPFILDAISCIGEGGRYDLVDIDVAEKTAAGSEYM